MTEERLVLYPRAVFAALVLAFALVVGSADGAETLGGRLGGDYAAFYAAGRLLVEGRAAELYDAHAQAETQATLYPGAPGAFLFFAYPPFVALPYAALSALGFVWGYTLHTVLAAAALWAAIRTLRPQLTRWEAHPFALFVWLLSFYPMFRAIYGGQNTSFSLLIVALVARLLYSGAFIRAGAVAGLLLAKPQLGAVLIGLVALRHPRAAIGACVTALLLYGLSALVCGADWPMVWWERAVWFEQVSRRVDEHNSIGWIGWCSAIGGGPSAIYAGGALTLGTLLALCVLWRTRIDEGRRFALTSVGLVLLPPHSLYYDAGLASLALVILADRSARASLVALAWGAGLLAIAAPALGVNPLSPVLAGIGVMVLCATEPQRHSTVRGVP